MARTDVIVLGAGIIGTSAALHLAKRGLAVALVDRGGVGEGTSYGNGGIIEGNTYFPYPFPTNPRALLRIALKQATEANYHLSYLPKMLPWLFAYWRAGAPEHMFEFANGMRPLFAAAVAEHEALMKEAGAEKYLRKNGWLKIYRNAASLPESAVRSRRDREEPVSNSSSSTRPARSRSSRISRRFSPMACSGRRAASISNPLAVTRAYAARFSALGGVVLKGDARTLHRANERWRVDTDEGPVDAPQAVIALGPWSQKVLDPLGLKLPLQVKRGYHLHFKPRGNKGISRPTLDADVGYLIAPMEQGLRLTTGAEFAVRRCAADAGAIRPPDAEGARTVSARRAGRADAVDGIAAELPGFTSGDRPRAGPERSLARFRPHALGPDARSGERTAAGGDDDGRDAVLRSRARIRPSVFLRDR